MPAAVAVPSRRRRRPPDYARLRRIAMRKSQRGYFTVQQAERANIDRRTLARLAQRGVVHRESRGLYRFTVTAAPTWRDVLAGRLLTTNGRASGRTAVALYGLIEAPPEPDILVERGSHRAVSPHHTTRELRRDECAVVDGLPTLHPVRAILDAAHRLEPAAAIAMVEAAIVRKLVTPIALERRARELTNAKRPGCKVVLAILAELHPELSRARNEWEALVARRAREFGLPLPTLEYEVRIEGRRYILDAAWDPQLVALEFAGRDPHMRRRVHDNDSVRHNDFESTDWKRFTITSTELARPDGRTFRLVAEMLATRSVTVGRASSRMCPEVGTTADGS